MHNCETVLRNVLDFEISKTFTKTAHKHCPIYVTHPRYIILFIYKVTSKYIRV